MNTSINTLENKQCLSDLESEWDDCVQETLDDVGESVTASLQRRVNARIDSAGMFDALALPYRGALRERDAELVGREALRMCRRDLSHDLDDVILVHGGCRHGRLLKFKRIPNIQISRNKKTLSLALIADVIVSILVIALMLVCMIMLWDVVKCSWDIYNRQEIQLPSSPNELFDESIWKWMPKLAYKAVKFVGDKVMNIYTMVENVCDIVKIIVEGLVGLFALAATTVLLWILSIWHKIIARCSVARQAEGASQQIIDHLSKEISLRKEKLLRDSDLAEK